MLAALRWLLAFLELARELFAMAAADAAWSGSHCLVIEAKRDDRTAWQVYASDDA